MNRLLAGGVTVVAAVAMTLTVVVTPVGAAGSGALGVGIAKFGPVNIFAIDDNTDGVRVDHADGNGVLQIHGVRYQGPLHLGTLQGFEDFCDSTPSCGPAIFDGSFFDLTNGTGLGGQNRDGQRVDGLCRGGSLQYGGVYGATLATQCTAAVSGGAPATFWLVMSGVVVNLNNGTVTGTFCIPDLLTTGISGPFVYPNVGCQNDLSLSDEGIFEGP